MPTDKLTDPKVRQAKPADRPYKLFDGGGLFLLVQPGGSKLWRLKYRFGGKEKLPIKILLHPSFLPIP